MILGGQKDRSGIFTSIAKIPVRSKLLEFITVKKLFFKKMEFSESTYLTFVSLSRVYSVNVVDKQFLICFRHMTNISLCSSSSNILCNLSKDYDCMNHDSRSRDTNTKILLLYNGK